LPDRSAKSSQFVIRDFRRLAAEARFDYLLNRTEAGNIGAKVNAAMRDIEKHTGGSEASISTTTTTTPCTPAAVTSQSTPMALANA